MAALQRGAAHVCTSNGLESYVGIYNVVVCDDDDDDDDDDNNDNNQDNVYGAVIMAEPLREFTRFI